jgi:hypothetical protein
MTNNNKTQAKICGDFKLKTENFLLAAPIGTARPVLYDN